MGSVALGSSSAGGATNLGLDICYTYNNGSLQGGGQFILIAEPQNASSLHSLQKVFGSLAAGTYNFGLCYATTSGNWNRNDYVSNTVLVF
jgi:protein involved in ribonucleotide reduction